MEDLNADERRFIQIMFPHLLEPDSPHSVRVQSPVPATHRHSTPGIMRSPLNVTQSSPRQAHSIPGIMRTSSPLNVTRTFQAPDWGTPITEDYRDPVSPSRYSRSPQQQTNYTINSDREKAIPARHLSEPTAELSWDVLSQPQDDNRDSVLRKFDRSLQAEYNRRRRAYSAGLSSPQAQRYGEHGRRSMLAIQADNLAKAEALALFSEAVEAAERAAAAQVDPSEKECQAARAYEARLVEAVSGEAESGGLPIEVVAYVGVTVPKNPIPQRH